jgi:hypothetical protein
MTPGLKPHRNRMKKITSKDIIDSMQTRFLPEEPEDLELE